MENQRKSSSGDGQSHQAKLTQEDLQKPVSIQTIIDILVRKGICSIEELYTIEDLQCSQKQKKCEEPNGQSEGQSAGQPEGQSNGQSEGQSAGQPEGQSNGQSEGQSAGQPEGQPNVQSDGQSAGQPERQPNSQSEGQSAGSSGSPLTIALHQIEAAIEPKKESVLKRLMAKRHWSRRLGSMLFGWEWQKIKKNRRKSRGPLLS